MPECYIRGSTIKYLRIPDEVIDMVKDEAVAKGRGRGGLQQQKQQKGRGLGGAGRGRRVAHATGMPVRAQVSSVPRPVTGVTVPPQTGPVPVTRLPWPGPAPRLACVTTRPLTGRSLRSPAASPPVSRRCVWWPRSRRDPRHGPRAAGEEAGQTGGQAVSAALESPAAGPSGDPVLRRHWA
jgi:hypothetical protein